MFTQTRQASHGWLNEYLTKNTRFQTYNLAILTEALYMSKCLDASKQQNRVILVVWSSLYNAVDQSTSVRHIVFSVDKRMPFCFFLPSSEEN